MSPSFTVATPPPARTAGPVAAPRELVNALGMRFVFVPPGRFIMGSPADEKGRAEDEHQHEVRLTKSFYLAVTQVTQAEFVRVLSRNPSWFQPDHGGGKDKVVGLETGRLPVESVSWNDAMEFCRVLSDYADEKQAGRAYRLPTEAEWEYACRGGPNGTTDPFHFGPMLSAAQANIDGRYPYGGAPRAAGLERPSPVGSYGANPLGLFDLHGNVWEWCADWYEADYYQAAPREDPGGPPASRERCRVLRGGSWGDGAMLCRCACRTREDPNSATIFIGFRVVMMPVSVRP
jgi:formylglycine-generating enzyme required for sulfatase activity